MIGMEGQYCLAGQEELLLPAIEFYFCLTGASEGEATGISVGVESGSDEEPIPQRGGQKHGRTSSRDVRQSPVRQQSVAHGSGEEQHSTSEVVDIPGVSNDRPGDTSRAGHWVISH